MAGNRNGLGLACGERGLRLGAERPSHSSLDHSTRSTTHQSIVQMISLRGKANHVRSDSSLNRVVVGSRHGSTILRQLYSPRILLSQAPSARSFRIQSAQPSAPCHLVDRDLNSPNREPKQLLLGFRAVLPLAPWEFHAESAQGELIMSVLVKGGNSRGAGTKRKEGSELRADALNVDLER